MQAKYGEEEIKTLLMKIRIFNKEIGHYEMFAITEHFDYVVKLSNGKIRLTVEELQEEENDTLTPEKLSAIAARFSPSAETSKEPASTKRSPEMINRIILCSAVVLVAVAVWGILSTREPDTVVAADKQNPSTYTEKVISLEETERARPADFLFMNCTYRENFLGNKIKVKAVITNKSKTAVYKEAIVRFRYYDKAKTELSRKEYTVNETFKPGEEKTVTIKIDNPKNTKSLGWAVVGAKAE